MEAATALAAAISFSSCAWPCTTELAASHRLPVALATSLACGGEGGRKGRENDREISEGQRGEALPLFKSLYSFVVVKEMRGLLENALMW